MCIDSVNPANIVDVIPYFVDEKTNRLNALPKAS